MHYGFERQRDYLREHESGLGIISAFTDIMRDLCPARFGNETVSVVPA